MGPVEINFQLWCKLPVREGFGWLFEGGRTMKHGVLHKPWRETRTRAEPKTYRFDSTVGKRMELLFFFAFCGSHNFVRCASPPANAHTLGQFPRKTDWPNDVQSWMSCTIAYLGATVQQRRTKHNNDQCYNSSITTCEPATFNTLQRMENYVRMQVESGPGLRILI
jgi:hypothetical protein